VGRDLDAFTHFHELDRRIVGTPLLYRIQVLCKELAVAAISLAFSVAFLGNAVLAAERNLPRLFTALVQENVAAERVSMPEAVDSMERVVLDRGVLGLPAFSGVVAGHEFVAERLDSSRGNLSETFDYRTGPTEARSVFTIYSGVVYGNLVVEGKSYFISPEGNHFLVVRSARRETEELLRYAPRGDLQSIGAFATGYSRRRACCFFPPPPSGIVTIAIATDYVAVLGGEEKARARAQHMIDRQNATFKNSGFAEAKFVNPEAIVIDPPEAVIERGLYDWAVSGAGKPIITGLRKRNKAAATFILSKGTHVSEALRNAPGKWLPDIQVAVVGGFFAEWDDSDIRAFIHEAGHLCGGDHNIESAPPQASDPQGTNRDWYDCADGVRGALSYNPCGKFLETVEIYSGVNSFWHGKATGHAGVNDNVSGMRIVWRDLAGPHD